MGENIQVDAGSQDEKWLIREIPVRVEDADTAGSVQGFAQDEEGLWGKDGLFGAAEVVGQDLEVALQSQILCGLRPILAFRKKK